MIASSLYSTHEQTLKTSGFQNLTDISRMPFNAFRQKIKRDISWRDSSRIYKESVAYVNGLYRYRNQVLARANPQLQKGINLGIQQWSQQSRSYESMFGNRSSSYVRSESVASMFSPAAYLTELYREGRKLHDGSSPRNIDNRRPDIKNMLLSQSNMDTVISTLTLSNEILLANVAQKTTKSTEAVYADLAQYNKIGLLPYHQALEVIEQSIAAKGQSAEELVRLEAFASQIEDETKIALSNDISPELYRLLTEVVTESNAAGLVKSYFGEGSINTYLSVDYLKRYFSLNDTEIAEIYAYLLNNSTLDLTQDSIVTLALVSGKLQYQRVERTKVNGNGNIFNYLHLVPRSTDGKLQLTFNVKERQASASDEKIKIYNGTDSTTGKLLYESDDLSSIANQAIQVSPPLDLKSTYSLFIQIYNSDDTTASNGEVTYSFNIDSLPPEISLLKLNKLIKAVKAYGLSSGLIENVVRATGELQITKDVLAALSRIRLYIDRYGISESDAQVLAGYSIPVTSGAGSASPFDLLFNTPPLQNHYFALSGATIDFNPSKQNEWELTKSTVKRAMRANDADMYALVRMADRDSDNLKIDLPSLSNVYRIKLLANVHSLTVSQLKMLLTSLGYDSNDIVPTTDADWFETLINRLNGVVNWLNEQSLSVELLYAMTTKTYLNARSAKIDNLVQTIFNGVEDKSLTGDTLKEAIAPYIAADLGLSSTQNAFYLLKWLDAIADDRGVVKTDEFWSKIKEKPTAPTQEVVHFIHAMAQLALIINTWQLDTELVINLATQPQHFIADAKSFVLSADNLILISKLQSWLSQAGSNAVSLLASLFYKTLSAAELFTAFGYSESSFAQAIEYVRGAGQKLLSNFNDVMDVMTWVEVADRLGVTPSVLKSLLNLRVVASDDSSSDAAVSASSYDDWQTVAGKMQAVLSDSEAKIVNSRTAEKLSAALYAYFVSLNPALGISSRDQLYEYLLIDNQVSGEVTTSRIAEAISSLQFYISRCIQGLEPDVKKEQLTLTFFEQWDIYNKRYSTWAGVSQLVYYPENYIDPTQRINQSGLMDDFLQKINQSKLTKDTIEDGFKNYLSSFEQVANLEVIAAYHDGLSNDGISYFTARSRTPTPEYYWRQVDHSMFIAGKFAAAAWSDWLKIDSPVEAIGYKLRPVVFNSRLYILWVEERKQEVQSDTIEQNKPVEISTNYFLNLSYRRYDGGWSAPFSYNLNENIGGQSPEEILKLIASDGDWDFYLSNIFSVDAILVTFYKPGDYSTYPPASGTADVFDKKTTVYIYPDLNAELVNSKDYMLYYHDQLNNAADNKVSNVIYDTDQPVVYFNFEGNTQTSFLSIKNVTLNQKVVKSGTQAELSITPSFNVSLSGLVPDLANLVEQYEKYNGSKLQNFLYTTLKWTDDKSGLPPELAALATNNNKITDFPILIADEVRPSGQIRKQAILYINNDKLFDAHVVGLLTGTTNDLQTGYLVVSFAEIDGDKYWYGANGEENFTFWNLGNTKRTLLFLNNPAASESDAKYSVVYSDSVVVASPSNSNVKIELNGKTVLDKADVKNGQLFSGATYSADVALEATGIPVSITLGSGSDAAVYKGNFDVHTPVVSNTVMTIHTTAAGAQYLENKAYRTRLNTLFAQELVKRANAGIDAILTYETQQIQEPQLGRGFYVDLELPPYDPAKHGDSMAFKIYYRDIVSYGGEELYYQGSLRATGATIVSLFVPYFDDGYHGSSANTMIIDVEFASGLNQGAAPQFTYDPATNTAKLKSLGTLVTAANVLNKTTEPMDFNGANGLYFWELFYYSPMMAAQRLLTEQNFSESERWLKYVFNPGGYTVDGVHTDRQWNVRPLEEDAGWDDVLLDSTDPDAIAQIDPMHYKLATFMRLLDLQIARGDMAYRTLERDTLTEAKIWYLSALSLLGEEPYIPLDSNWSSPTLSAAADETAQQEVLNRLDLLNQQYVVFSDEQLRTANTLTALFLPTENTRLKAYWQTLRQRMFNLRHNLTIDGQPLALPLFAEPADPKALLNAAIASAAGGESVTSVNVGAYRFMPMLDSARNLVNQLMQYGSTLTAIIEKQDAEAMALLMQTQAQELFNTTISIQDRAITQVGADRRVLEQSLAGVQARYDSYRTLYDEDVNQGEQSAMDLRVASSTLLATSQAMEALAAGLDLVPNIYGLAVGGSKYGGVARAVSYGIQTGSTALAIEAEKLSQSEIYRRRRQEWGIQRDNAQHEINQINAQLESNSIQRQAAELQKKYLQDQQAQTVAQLTFLQTKYTSGALYSWMRGRLAALYYQLYDIAASRCMLAQASYSWETGDSQVYIQSGNWQDNYAGLLSGEGLALNLASLESKYLAWDKRALEVERTVSLANLYAELSDQSFNIATALPKVINGDGKVGNTANYLELDSNNVLNASVAISEMKIAGDYPEAALSLGDQRRVKQISVTLPALLGPYQDVQAVLSYVGSDTSKLNGRSAIAVSHGMNDSGQFQLDFNDEKYLPFEGISISDAGTFVLRFPNAKDKQKALLESLNNIVLHIRYTIRSAS